MSSRWHYRIHGRDVGPVDFATLQVMASEERLFADDEVRDEASQQWVPAGTVPGLFPEAADEDDLSSMLSDADMPAAVEDRADSDDQCFCRTRTEELGPMSFSKLVSLARAGRLGRRDQVRVGARGNWVEARSIAGLFDEPQRPASQASVATAEIKAEASILETMEIVADQTPQKTRSPRTTPEPALKLVDEGLNDDDVAPVAVSDEDALWHCRVLGQEIGPIPWTDMRELVETRQLGPNDRVRKGQSVAWVPAATIDNLFPKRKKQRLTKKKKEKISEEDVLDILQPDEPEEEEVSSHLAPQRNFGKPSQRPSSEMQVRPANRNSDPDSAPRPVPTAPPPGSAAAAAPPVRPPMTPPRPQPQREKRKLGNPFSGLGGSIGSLRESLGDIELSMKPILAVVAAVLVVGALVWGGAGLMSPGQKTFSPEMSRMWLEAQSLRKAKNQGGWVSFNERYSGRVAGYVKRLTEDAGDPLNDALLVVFRDCMPKMLEAPIDGADDEWTRAEEAMKQAETLDRGG